MKRFVNVLGNFFPTRKIKVEQKFKFEYSKKIIHMEAQNKAEFGEISEPRKWGSGEEELSQDKLDICSGNEEIVVIVHLYRYLIYCDKLNTLEMIKK